MVVGCGSLCPCINSYLCLFVWLGGVEMKMDIGDFEVFDEYDKT